MITLNDLIRDHQTGDPDVTADAVMSAAGVPLKWRTMFYGVVRDECRRQARSLVRDAEGGQAHDEAQVPNAPAASRADYLGERFFNGERYVTWADATVADHEGRIAFLDAMRGGISRTIDRHAEAIERILTTPGATCLRDVEGEGRAS